LVSVGGKRVNGEGEGERTNMVSLLCTHVWK
jgi:hypothetical protein